MCWWWIDKAGLLPMRHEHVLVLGGTREARKAAELLTEHGLRVTFSLAGVTERPLLPAGAALRMGGFGGAQGLAEWIVTYGVAAVVDATHPYAAVMGRNACRAAGMTDVPLVRLERPAWRPHPGDRWVEVPSLKVAARMLPSQARVMSWLGGRGLAALTGRGDLWLVARLVSGPSFSIPPRWRILHERPRRGVAGEMALLRGVRAEWAVCRNSGGHAGRGKLEAARRLGLPVMMIARPEKPSVPLARNVEELIPLLEARLSSS